jgi:NADPH-dependent 2,4-dienoyl-CoA reductase/sulfur reductase-like enzyme
VHCVVTELADNNSSTRSTPHQQFPLANPYMAQGRMVRWAAVLGMAMAVHAGSSRPARCEEGRVLVVGAGLAGLGAADALRRHGCDVTVLEASNLHGGT